MSQMSHGLSENELNRIVVSGSGSVRTQPDTATVSIGVVTENESLAVAQNDNTLIMNRVLASVIRDGVPPEDIQTRVYNVQPQYDFVEGRQVFRGYKVEHIIDLTIRNINIIGEVIDGAVENGANMVSNVIFSISNPAEYYQLALNRAVEDAVQKAVSLGRKINVEVIVPPLRIVELGYSSVQPVPLGMRDFAAATPIQAGQETITAKIEAVFEYKPV